MPSILRPKPAAHELIDDYDKQSNTPTHSLHRSVGIRGNRIIHFDSLEHCVTDFLTQHSKERRYSCKTPQPYWPQNGERTFGQGIQVKTACRNCTFKYEHYQNLYEEVHNRHEPGPAACKLNAQISLFHYKSSLSYEDYELLCISLDMNCLSECHYYRKSNEMATHVKQTSQAAIDNNRNRLKSVLLHDKSKVLPTGKVAVAAETDTVFNNPNHGRGFSAPGTQSTTCYIENETNEKLVIGVNSANQLCSGPSNCNHESCGMNFDPNASIASSEKKASHDLFMEVHDADIQICELAHDGINASTHQAGANQAAHEAGIEHPDSCSCTTHMSHGQKQQTYKCDLACNDKPRETRIKYIGAIALSLKKRVHLEMIFAFKKAKSDEEFIGLCQRSRSTIIKCFHGDHSECTQNSLVCKGPTDKAPTHLPNSMYLYFNQAERERLYQKVILYRMSDQRLQLQKRMRHTNTSESFNRSILKLNPKHKTYRKYYNVRAMSAVQTNAQGIANAVLHLAEAAGIPLTKQGWAAHRLRRKQKRVVYQKDRARSLIQKSRRKHLRLKLSWVKGHRRLNLQDGPIVRDHMNYGSV